MEFSAVISITHLKEPIKMIFLAYLHYLNISIKCVIVNKNFENFTIENGTYGN